MPSSLFLAVAAITALVSILSTLFLSAEENSHKKRRISHTYLVEAILITIVITFGLIRLSRYLGDAMSNTEYATQRITILEEEIAHLENMIFSLREENQNLESMISSLKEEIYEANSKKHLVMFDILDYDGLIIPDYSVNDETKTVSIALDPADGYFIECLDSNNNKIDPYSTDDDKWTFIMPDSDITFYIRKK